MEPEPTDELPPELKQGLTRYHAPPGLARRIRYMLEQPQQAPAAPPTSRLARWWRGRQPGWAGAMKSPWLAMGGSFALGAMLAALVLSLPFAGRDDAAFDQQAVASHVRSLMVAHLSDVASSDRHTVKPWFAGKLDYTPVVIDLAGEGFALVGGRLDYLHGQATAALVYQRRQHIINVFVRPEPAGGKPAPHTARQQGYNLLVWNAAGMQFTAVSDASADELQMLAAGIRAAAGG